MAAAAKKKTENTVEEKLRALYRLQLIDSAIDKIRTIRGELPLEVEDLQDEIEGLETRLNNLQTELEDVQNRISERKNSIIDSSELIKKYESQQKNVRNNREFDSLSKEIEFQTLEIQRVHHLCNMRSPSAAPYRAFGGCADLVKLKRIGARTT